MVSHVIVRDGDGSGAMDGIDEPIMAVWEWAVVHPDMAPTKDGYPIPVWYRPPPVVTRGISHVSVPPLLAVMDVESMYDNVGHILYSNACSTCNMDASTPAIDGLEGVHYQLFLQLDNHIPRKDDPQGLILDDCITQSPGLWIHHIIITGVRHDVNLPILPTNGILPKSNCAIRQALPVLLPVGVTPPAVINGVPAPTWKIPQVPPRLVDLPTSQKKKRRKEVSGTLLTNRSIYKPNNSHQPLHNRRSLLTCVLLVPPVQGPELRRRQPTEDMEKGRRRRKAKRETFSSSTESGEKGGRGCLIWWREDLKREGVYKELKARPYGVTNLNMRVHFAYMISCFTGGWFGSSCRWVSHE